MEKIIKDTVLKYTGIVIENGEDNWLDYPVYREMWLYVILELQEKWGFPMLKVIEEIDASEFNLNNVIKKVKEVSNELVD